MDFDFENKIREKTDTDLESIILNSENYNPDFVLLAEKELVKRNISIDPLKRIKERVQVGINEQLAEGKSGNPFYIFICFVLALLGGVLGIYAGYIYSQSKTKGAHGEEFFVYNEQTRKLGRVMMWLGIACAAFYIVRQL